VLRQVAGCQFVDHCLIARRTLEAGDALRELAPADGARGRRRDRRPGRTAVG
jgi:hypothetical protein